jgi:hypothetical protein
MFRNDPLPRAAVTQTIAFAGKEASTVRRTTLGRYVVPLIVEIGIFCIANAEAANEARCIELGNSCIASEPLEYRYLCPGC